MLERFVASNGVVIEHSSIVRTVSVLKNGIDTDLVLTLMHQHFDEGTPKNAFGKFDKEIREALEELCNSLGITKMKRGRKDGRRKQLNRKG